MRVERLLIDTDPGVDDAAALLLAAGHPGARIEAVTVVGGNVGLENTLANTCTVLDLVESSAPVFAGCGLGLVYQNLEKTTVHGSDGLGDVGFPPSSRAIEEEHASAAIVRLANDEPGELTLVALGPLTNVALAVRLDPELPHKLKRLVVMGGAVNGRGNTVMLPSEFNFLADPEAAFVTLDAWSRAGQMVELVDWEVTQLGAVSAEELERWFVNETPYTRFLSQILAPWLEITADHYEQPLFHPADPLAMAVAIEPEIVLESEDRFVVVETQGRHTRGQSVVDWASVSGKSPNVRIVKDVAWNYFYQSMIASLQ